MKKPFITFALFAAILLILGAAFWRYGYKIGLTPSDAVIERMSDKEKAEAMQKTPIEPMATIELKPEEKANENSMAITALSEGTPERIASFVGVTIHKAEGMARVVKNDDHLQIVFDEGFTVTPGPGLYVYVSSKRVDSFRDLNDGGVELAKLKATRGTQVYDLPTGTKLEDIKSIIVACKPYKVLFGKAIIE